MSLKKHLVSKHYNITNFSFDSERLAKLILNSKSYTNLGMNNIEANLIVSV